MHGMPIAKASESGSAVGAEDITPVTGPREPVSSCNFLQSASHALQCWSPNEDRGSAMRVVVSEFTSLDGIVQAPGGPQEDTSGGFRHGGWSIPFFDPDVMGAVIGEVAERSDALLQGRRPYEVSATAWPERSGDPFADWINGVQKYVVSDTLAEANLSWTPTTIIRGADLVKEVSE